MNSKRALILFCVTGCGTGYLPASGTCATLFVGLPLAYYLSSKIALSVVSSLMFALTSTSVALLLIHYAVPLFTNSSDPEEIVIDEIVGFLWACVGLQYEPYRFAIAFLLFRFFDVSKWGPVGYMERLPGAWGILGDDIVAGLITRCIICLI